MNNNYTNSLNFEKLCIKLHIEKYNHKTYHWHNIPEDLLYDSGFITKFFGSFAKLRSKRKEDKENNKINSVQEYGLDGISEA